MDIILAFKSGKRVARPHWTKFVTIEELRRSKLDPNDVLADDWVIEPEKLLIYVTELDTITREIINMYGDGINASAMRNTIMKVLMRYLDKE